MIIVMDDGGGDDEEDDNYGDGDSEGATFQILAFICVIHFVIVDGEEDDDRDNDDG